MLIDPHHPELSIRRQCELLGLASSTLYYHARSVSEVGRETAFNEALMRWIDRQYLDTPFYGYRKMTAAARRDGFEVNPKRVRRLMRLMGIEAIYAKPKTSLQNKVHPVYPYLLKGLTIDRPDQVWCTDITYLPLRRGWVYLVAVMDWYSRFVVSWEVSVTLDAGFCVDALEAALGRGTPEVFNSDQGSQFTSEAFTSVLLATGVRISMDGRRRCYDNIFIERLWRSLKHEHVYLHDHQTVAEMVSGVDRWIRFYNHQRPHAALDYRTPSEAYGEVRSPVGAGPEELNSSTAVAPVALRAPCTTAASPPEQSP